MNISGDETASGMSVYILTRTATAATTCYCGGEPGFLSLSTRRRGNFYFYAKM